MSEEQPELHTAVAKLRIEVAALHDEVAAMRKEMAPILRWKAGAVAVIGIVITLGFLARAVDWIIELWHVER